jgi:peptidoglycan biosynthesis protein MviN/MurJ (putative lipid II flippase)
VIGAQVAIGTPASIIAAHYGIVWVAVAFTVTGWLVTPVSFVFLERFTHVGFSRQFAALRGILVATAVMAVAVLSVQHAMRPHAGDAAVLTAGVLVGVVTYLVVIMLIDRSLLRSVLRDMTRRNRAVTGMAS